VNNVLLDHNIEKQKSDSRGEVAYLMADISNVKEGEIRDLFQSLEELSCKYPSSCRSSNEANPRSLHPHQGALLESSGCLVSGGPELLAQ
jgi:hypothetical protein